TGASSSAMMLAKPRPINPQSTKTWPYRTELYFLNPPRKFQIYPTPNRCIYIQPGIMSTRNYANRQRKYQRIFKEEFAI
ncbi:hypothetical protein ACIPH3_15150, partial [Enterobacter sp. CER55]